MPAKVTAKMLEREKYHKALQEEDGQQACEDEEEVLEVFDEQELDVADRRPSEEDASPHQVTEFEVAAGKGKGKAKAKAAVPLTPDDSHSEATAGKRRRPPMDPFAGLLQLPLAHVCPSNPQLSFPAGYGDGPDTRPSGTSAETGSKPSASRSGAKVRRIHLEGVSAEASSGPNTPSGGENHDKVKKTKKRSKKRAAP
jgi:hypothetical protein